jgi:hypothetical protein
MSNVYRFIFSAIVLLIGIFGSLWYFSPSRFQSPDLRNRPIKRSEPRYVNKFDLTKATTIMNSFKGNFKRLQRLGTPKSMEMLSSNISLVETTIPELQNVVVHVTDSQVSALLGAFGEFLEKYRETARSLKSTWEEWSQIDDQRKEIQEKARKDRRNAPYGEWQSAQLAEKEQELVGGSRSEDQLQPLEQTFQKLLMRLERLTMIAAEMKQAEG